MIIERHDAFSATYYHHSASAPPFRQTRPRLPRCKYSSPPLRRDSAYIKNAAAKKGTRTRYFALTHNIRAIISLLIDATSGLLHSRADMYFPLHGRRFGPPRCSLIIAQHRGERLLRQVLHRLYFSAACLSLSGFYQSRARAIISAIRYEVPMPSALIFAFISQMLISALYNILLPR